MSEDHGRSRKLGSLQRKILATLRLNPGGLNVRDLTVQLRNPPFDYSAIAGVRRAALRLVNAGYLERSTTGPRILYRRVTPW